MSALAVLLQGIHASHREQDAKASSREMRAALAGGSFNLKRGHLAGLRYRVSEAQRKLDEAKSRLKQAKSYYAAPRKTR